MTFTDMFSVLVLQLCVLIPISVKSFKAAHAINVLNFQMKKLNIHNHIAHKWLGYNLKSFLFDSRIQAFDCPFVSHKVK